MNDILESWNYFAA